MKKFFMNLLLCLGVLSGSLGLAACGGDDSGSVSGSDNSSSEAKAEYTVTYNANGGAFENGETTITETINANATLTAPQSPQRANYTFDGWATNALGVDKWNFATDKVTKDVTLYAVWTQQSAAILSVDGASIEDQEIFMFVDKDTESVSLASKVVCSDDSVWKLYYDKLGQMEIPTKIASSQSGELLGGDNVFYVVVTSKDGLQTNLYELNVYRSYAVSVNYYDEETLLKTETVYTGYEYTTNYTPEITGYTFNGWGYTTRVLWDALNLYADKTAHTYTVACDVNGGNELANTNVTVTYDSDYTLEKPIRTGYTFLGWYDGETQMTDEKGASLTPWQATNNVTVRAMWQANVYTVTLVRSLEEGGSVSGGGEHAYDSNVRITAALNKGYTWLGWYDKNDELVTMEFSHTFQMGFDVEYTAKWMVCPVTIEKGYWWEGEATDLTKIVTVLGEQTTITATVESGYTWLGWYNGETLLTNELSYTFEMSTANVTYTAKRAYYALTTNTNLSDAGTYTERTNYGIAAGTETTITANTNRGYTWLGWYNGETLLTDELSYTFEMPANDIAYTAKWEVRDEMANFKFESTATTCTITGIKDKTVTEIVVPDYVTQIKGGALSGCSSLESITVPFVGGSVKTEEDTYQYPFGYIFGETEYQNSDSAWQDYYGSSTSTTTSTRYYTPKNLKTVTVTGGNILYGAFNDCETITSIIISGNVTKIGIQAFSSCDSLKSVTLSDSVATIEREAFYSCSSLTSITLGDGVTSISDSAFSDCNSLQFNEYGNAKYLGSKTNDYFALIEVTDKTLSSYTIHNGTKIIAEYAFDYCRSLTSIEIPDSVTSIGSCAFYNCSSLTSVTIGDGVTSIGNYAFSGCSSLTSITLGDGVISISDSAFSDCNSLQFNEYGNAKYLGSKTNDYFALIKVTDKTLSSYTIHNSTKIIMAYAFNGCSSLTSIEIPDNVTSIGNYAFSGCSSLTSVTIPDGVTTIGKYTFRNCNSLKSITIPDSVTFIDQAAFYWCSSLTSVYYKGTATDWTEISINNTDDANYYINSATRYYYSENVPTTAGNYWRYVDGEIVVW